MAAVELKIKYITNTLLHLSLAVAHLQINYSATTALLYTACISQSFYFTRGQLWRVSFDRATPSLGSDSELLLADPAGQRRHRCCRLRVARVLKRLSGALLGRHLQSGWTDLSGTSAAA